MHLKSDQLTSLNVCLFQSIFVCLECWPADGFLCGLGVDSQSGQWVGCVIYVYNLYSCVFYQRADWIAQVEIVRLLVL